ncbi:MAG: FUSC family protein [Campylobacterota bacterium]|nr:FUSC family protein [Campylobacterota bacterium]
MFNDKLKFSIKVSLSMALAFLIPLSQGWPQAHVAPITIMLIAAMGSVHNSIVKGAMRTLGTIIGAIIGMSLIALFPQERFLYLLSLSILVTLTLYLVRAYKGDHSIFMLSAMTMLMVFDNGNVDNVFLFGVDKTYMTIFGIVIYSLVGVFLWPVNIQDSSKESAKALSTVQLNLFLKHHSQEKEHQELLVALRTHEELLQNAIIDSRTIPLQNYKNIGEYLTLLANHDTQSYEKELPLYISNYKKAENEITLLLENIIDSTQNTQEIIVPKALTIQYDFLAIKDLSHLQRASLLTYTQNLEKLHNELTILAKNINSINSPMPTLFSSENLHVKNYFLWGDIEHLKGSLVTFIIFWVSTFVWITMNPPGGFMIVTLATGLSVLTTFSPLKPSTLTVVFTLSFIFATLMYIFILPNLHYGWELGIFIFVYSFIAFYFVPSKLSIFFLLGLFTLGISNEMHYNFALFLLILTMFYMFLITLQLFYYIPFSTKPEHLFMTMKKRFFRLSKILADHESNLQLKKEYANTHLKSTVKNMQLWASKIDTDYFDTLNQTLLIDFTKESEKFIYLLKLLYQREKPIKDNPLLKILRESYTLPTLSNVLQEHTISHQNTAINSLAQDEQETIQKVEESLNRVLKEINFDLYSKEIISDFYEIISLRKDVWISLFSCQKIMCNIDFAALQRSRF